MADPGATLTQHKGSRSSPPVANEEAAQMTPEKAKPPPFAAGLGSNPFGKRSRVNTDRVCTCPALARHVLPMSRDRPMRLVTAYVPAGVVGFEALAPHYRDGSACSSRGRLRLALFPGDVRLRRWRYKVIGRSSLRHLRQEAFFLALLLGNAPGLLLAEESRSCPRLARRRFHVCGALVLRTSCVRIGARARSVAAQSSSVTVCMHGARFTKGRNSLNSL